VVQHLVHTAPARSAFGAQLAEQVLGRYQHFGVLLQELGEVLKERVLWPEEVELEVALLPTHKVGQKLPTITSHKLRG